MPSKKYKIDLKSGERDKNGWIENDDSSPIQIKSRRDQKSIFGGKKKSTSSNKYPSKSNSRERTFFGTLSKPESIIGRHGSYTEKALSTNFDNAEE